MKPTAWNFHTFFDHEFELGPKHCEKIDSDELTLALVKLRAMKTGAQGFDQSALDDASADAEWIFEFIKEKKKVSARAIEDGEEEEEIEL